jgi:hypothetical protein
MRQILTGLLILVGVIGFLWPAVAGNRAMNAVEIATLIARLTTMLVGLQLAG